MSSTLPEADTTHPSGHSDRPASRGTGLLGLVRRLLDYGRTLVDTLHQRNTPDAPEDVAKCFASRNLALIIARITRGVWLADALERRMVRAEARRDSAAEREPQVRPIQDQPRPAVVRPKATKRKPVDEAAELTNLPSAREIAARVRGRAIGAVIVDICRDLGIDGSHPLWGEVLEAITVHGGNRAHMLNVVQRRSADRIRAEVIALAPDTVARFDRVCAGLWPSSWATPPP